MKIGFTASPAPLIAVLALLSFRHARTIRKGERAPFETPSYSKGDQVMPHLESIPGYYTDGSSFEYYNVRHPVGRGCVGFTDDVSLVQWFLDEIYKNHPEY